MKYFDNDLKWVGRVSRKLHKEKVYGNLKERRVYNYLNRYMNAAEKNDFSLDKINDTIQSDVVWVCWLQGLEKAPQLVKACIASIKRHVSQKVILITAENYLEFVNIPENDLRILFTHINLHLRSNPKAGIGLKT